MARQIYIDVTEFHYWKGNFTGIQRVVYSLTNTIKQQSDLNVQLVVYYQGKYQLLGQRLDDYIKNGLRFPHARTRQETVLAKLRHIYSTLPRPVQAVGGAATPVVKKGVKVGLPKARYALHHYRLFRAKISKGSNSQIHVESGNEQSVLKPGGYLLLPGTLWADNGHLEAAVGAKKVGLSVGVVIYDLIPIYLPHTFGQGMIHSYTKYLFETLSVSDDVFPISRSTAKDVIKFMEETGITNHPNIEVIRLGDKLPVSLSAIEENKLTTKFKSLGDFMICVGTIEARKNHTLLYQALKLAKEENQFEKLPHLILIGKRGWLSSDIINFLENDPAIYKKVTILDNLADAELAWLYEHARFSIYPSQYEGWGLPVAESLSYGTPVISSNASSMSEIAPKLTEFVSPYDPVGLLKAMLKLSDPAINRQIRDKIKQNYKPTSWEESAKPILKAIK
jgi:glycosyltransferase involved in cell wall biosynthesis